MKISWNRYPINRWRGLNKNVPKYCSRETHYFRFQGDGFKGHINVRRWRRTDQRFSVGDHLVLFQFYAFVNWLNCHVVTRANCSHTCASVTKQYSLVLAKGQWCSAAEIVHLTSSSRLILLCKPLECQPWQICKLYRISTRVYLNFWKLMTV